MKTTFIKVNNVDIQVLTIGAEKFVAIKPICTAIGVDFQTQLIKIKEDDIISCLYSLKKMTASNGKKHKMGSIPLKYVFGWLYTINPKNVKLEAKTPVLKYRQECYDKLFSLFEHRD